MCNGVLHGIYVGSANNCQSLTGIYTDVVFYKQWIDRIIDWGGEDPMPLPLPYARRRFLLTPFFFDTNKNSLYFQDVSNR